MSKIRLDTLLTRRGLAESRAKAQAVIMSGVVFVCDKRIDKPGHMLQEDAEAEIRGKTLKYVSRGGLKLEKALTAFDILPEGKCCMDCGASTGGFTDCLLQNGASHVYAVDVGYGQLDWKLRQDPRVTVLERTNIRHLREDALEAPPTLVTIDVSFISLRIVLPAVYALLAAEGEVISLIKPQFEAGREHVGKKGVIRDPAIHRQVLERFLEDAANAGFGVRALDYSPIRGPEGNVEYLGYLQKDKSHAAHIDPRAVVEASHQTN